MDVNGSFSTACFVATTACLPSLASSPARLPFGLPSSSSSNSHLYSFHLADSVVIPSAGNTDSPSLVWIEQSSVAFALALLFARVSSCPVAPRRRSWTDNLFPDATHPHHSRPTGTDSAGARPRGPLALPSS